MNDDHNEVPHNVNGPQEHRRRMIEDGSDPS